jgi:arsenate reductase
MTGLPIPTLPRVTLWLTPGNPEAQRALALLELVALNFEVRDVTTQPPTLQKLALLASWLPGGARALGRSQSPLWPQLGLDRATPEAILDAIVAHPDLLQRPIAFAAERRRALVPRPPELVLQLYQPEMPAGHTPESWMRRTLQRRIGG